MEHNSGNHGINCGVHSCKYNDKEARCTLHDIVVGNSKSSGEAHSKFETECESFVCDSNQ